MADGHEETILSSKLPLKQCVKLSGDCYIDNLFPLLQHIMTALYSLLQLLLLVNPALSFAPASRSERAHLTAICAIDNINLPHQQNQSTTTRKQLINNSMSLLIPALIVTSKPLSSQAKCTDIESCREEGERKIEADLKNNPIVKLSNGVRYRVLQPSTSGSKVKEGSSIDLIYSISTSSGQYMYSKGFGFEKIEFGNKLQSDLGLDSMRVTIGTHVVPIGIEMALMGMGRGERRRVELPPGVGFETSSWSPEPTTRRGKTQIEQYKRKLAGFGSQPPFPAETVWDIEVLGIRN